MATPPPTHSASGRFVGLIFMSIGVLWLGLTGLCTLGTFATLIGSDGLSAGLGDVALILIVAVPSALIGGAVYFVGRLLRPKV